MGWSWPAGESASERGLITRTRTGVPVWSPGAGYAPPLFTSSPQELSHLWALGAAGAVGFVGNESAAVVRLRAGRRLDGPALLADGYHACTDGLVSLGVMVSALLVALRAELADPLIGLAITWVILRITWHSWQTEQGDR